MTNLTNLQKINLVDDCVADDYNSLLAGILRASVSNTETITTTRELSDADCQMQIITPSGANRTIELPPVGVNNHVFLIKCANAASYDLLVKDDSGGTTYCTLDAGQWALCISDGSAWNIIYSGSIASATASNVSITDSGDYYTGTEVETALQEIGKYFYKNTAIEGMKLIWNSANSISVGVGRCYAENGDLINATSTLTASSLSLSANTWYHVYVYLNSGTPAVEVVTTAPATWKGTAYSKTGNTSRRYVGSVRTDGSGNVYEFSHVSNGGLILYSGDCDLDASPFRVLNGGTATTATSVSLSAVIPVTSQVGYLRLLNTANVPAYFGPTSNVNGPALGVGSSTQTSFLGQFPLTTSQAYYYKFNTAPSSGGAYIDVYGYAFER
jgi:hypothetical protein